MEAIVQVSMAVMHTTWQISTSKDTIIRELKAAATNAAATGTSIITANASSSSNSSTGGINYTYCEYHPRNVYVNAKKSMKTLMMSFEMLLTVWYSHTILEPTYRIANKQDIISFTSIPSVASVVQSSQYAQH